MEDYRKKPELDGLGRIRLSNRPIRLEHYRGGRVWEPFYVPDLRHGLAIGNTFFRIINGRCENHRRMQTIQASEDFGKTWHAYSKLPKPFKLSSVFPVFSGDQTLVYLIGCDRKETNRSEDSFDDGNDDKAYSESKMEIWVSMDLMETFQLVNDDNNFRYLQRPAFAGDDRGILYMVLAFSHTIWKSADMGRSWHQTVADKIESRYFFFGSCITAYKDRLFAIAYIKQDRHLVYSIDGGETWYRENISRPSLLLRDYVGDRLLCFSATRSFQLLGRSQKWKRLDANFNAAMLEAEMDSREVKKPNMGFVLKNGVIILRIKSLENICATLISYPNKTRAAMDKLLLIMYLRRKGIGSDLFQYGIAPFLFSDV